MFILGLLLAIVCLAMIAHSIFLSLQDPIERARPFYHSRGDILLFGLLFLGAIGVMTGGHILN